MRHRILSTAATSIVAVALTLIACSSSDDKKTLSNVATTATASDANNYCAAFCNWETRCNLVADAAVLGAAGGDCKTGCLRDAEPRRAVSRAAFFQNVAQCFSSLDCNHVATFCADNDSLGDPAFPNIKEVQDCLNKYNACGGVFSQDKCNSIAALTQDHRTSAEACTQSQDCDSIDKCLSAAGAFDDSTTTSTAASK